MLKKLNEESIYLANVATTKYEGVIACGMPSLDR